MEERRTRARDRVQMAAQIVFDGGASLLSCNLRNISEAGACLMVANASAVPEEFELQTDGGRRPCEVVWRQADRVGIRFRHATRGGADTPLRDGALGSISQAAAAHIQPCESCRMNMRLIHVLPASDGMPEVQAFRCENCGETLVREYEEASTIPVA